MLYTGASSQYLHVPGQLSVGVVKYVLVKTLLKLAQHCPDVETGGGVLRAQVDCVS